MRVKRITEKPFSQLCGREWKRAKKLLSPLLDNKRKPTILWDYRLGKKSGGLKGVGGYCYPTKGNGFEMMKFSWDSKKWWNKPVITISKKHTESLGVEFFVRILRHEILHLVEQKHNDRFRALCKELKTDRYYSATHYKKS